MKSVTGALMEIETEFRHLVQTRVLIWEERAEGVREGSELMIHPLENS